MRNVCLLWIGWFAAVGVTDSAITVFDILAQRFGVAVPSTISAIVYVALALASGFMVLWVTRQARELQSREAIKIEMFMQEMDRARERAFKTTR